MIGTKLGPPTPPFTPPGAPPGFTIVTTPVPGEARALLRPGVDELDAVIGRAIPQRLPTGKRKPIFRTSDCRSRISSSRRVNRHRRPLSKRSPPGTPEGFCFVVWDMAAATSLLHTQCQRSLSGHRDEEAETESTVLSTAAPQTEIVDPACHTSIERVGDVFSDPEGHSSSRMYDPSFMRSSSTRGPFEGASAVKGIIAGTIPRRHDDSRSTWSWRSIGPDRRSFAIRSNRRFDRHPLLTDQARVDLRSERETEGSHIGQPIGLRVRIQAS